MDGGALNRDGFARMQAGDFAGALPLLRQAVLALNGSNTLDEAYASYNLAFSRFAVGRCDGVIGLLDRSERIQGRRSEIDDLRRQWAAAARPGRRRSRRPQRQTGQGPTRATKTTRRRQLACCTRLAAAQRGRLGRAAQQRGDSRQPRGSARARASRTPVARRRARRTDLAHLASPSRRSRAPHRARPRDSRPVRRTRFRWDRRRSRRPRGRL